MYVYIFKIHTKYESAQSYETTLSYPLHSRLRSIMGGDPESRLEAEVGRAAVKPRLLDMMGLQPPWTHSVRPPQIQASQCELRSPAWMGRSCCGAKSIFFRGVTLLGWPHSGSQTCAIGEHWVVRKEREGMTLGRRNKRDLGRIEGEELGVDTTKTQYVCNSQRTHKK